MRISDWSSDVCSSDLVGIMAGNENSGRRMVPTMVHQFRGNPSKKPIAELTEQAIKWELVSDAPSCPAHLDDHAKEEWDRLAPDLYMLGLINKLDQIGRAHV